jgi:hypothetical protein
MLVDMLIHNLSSLASFLGIVASQVLSREQTVGFDDGTPTMHPLWLDGIEPGAFGRQKAGQNAYPFTRLSDLLVVLTNPGAYLLAGSPARRRSLREASWRFCPGLAAVCNPTPEIGWSEHSPDAP